MKRMRNVVLLLFCMMLLGGSFESMAAEQTVGDVLKGTGTGGINLQAVDEPFKEADILWSGKDNSITAYAKINAKQTSNITVTMKLQKLSGKVWSPMNTWTETCYGSTALLEKPYSLPSSGSYRVYAVFSVDGTTYTATSIVLNYTEGMFIQSVDFYE